MRTYDPKTGRSFYQKRRKRANEPGHARELTFSCYRRFAFLSADRTRAWFIEELDAARKQWAFDLWAYVLMPEHAHLLIFPRGSTEVGNIMGIIKAAVARKAVAHLKTHAPHWLPKITVREGSRVRHRFWQPGGGYDRNTVETATIHQMIEYIHANPVRRGLATTPEDWMWSSARWYTGLRPVPIEIDNTIPLHQQTVR